MKSQHNVGPSIAVRIVMLKSIWEYNKVLEKNLIKRMMDWIQKSWNHY